MLIDNSRAKAFLKCPAFYWERYVNNIEPVQKPGTSFGTRFHQLLESHYTGKPVAPVTAEGLAVEDEAQVMLEAYKAHYPIEPFDVVDCEVFFRLPLPGTHHEYCGEFDMIVREGEPRLFETKTERRGSHDNSPQAWASRSQVGLYLWAAEQVYEEKFGSILLNVCTRQSPKGQEAASFRRDSLERTEAQRRQAVDNIIWVADQIEALERSHGSEKLWPQAREQCVSPFGWKCDFYDLHVHEERSQDLIQIKYRQAEEYLAL